MIIDWHFIFIIIKIYKKFAIKINLQNIVLEIMIVDKINKINIYVKMVSIKRDMIIKIWIRIKFLFIFTKDFS